METKTRGRPRIAFARRVISITLPEGDAEALEVMALARQRTVHELLREAVRRLLREEKQP